MKTSELTGPALDWAVAKSLGVLDENNNYPDEFWDGLISEDEGELWSSNWRLAGPIIEREAISLCWQGEVWVASYYVADADEHWFDHQTGETPLIAAMRCFVASKLGDEVEVPVELN